MCERGYYSWNEHFNRDTFPRETPRARDLPEKKEPKRCPLCPSVLNDLLLSFLSLKCPFRPVLWPFCPVLCPFCPSHKLLKFAETVYATKFIDNFEGFSGIKGIFFFPGRILNLAWNTRACSLLAEALFLVFADRRKETSAMDRK